MKKITCNVLVILFAIFFPLMSIAQVKPDLDNQDSLIHYLKMDKHPEYPELSAFYIYKTLEQEWDNYDANMTLDIALKIFKVQDKTDYGNFTLNNLPTEIRLKELKITIYNLGNGKVQKIHLDKNSLGKETKQGKNLYIPLINANKVKDGSIVRCQIQFEGSGVFSKFSFQETLPVEYAAFSLKTLRDSEISVSEQVSIPFQKFVDKKYIETSTRPSMSAVYFEGRNIVHSWIRRKVPALELEPFNDEQEFEHVTFRFTDKHIEKKKKDWESELSKMTWQDYNSNLYTGHYQIAFEKNDYLYDLVPSIIHKEKDSFIIANLLFKYIQDNFTTLSRDRVFHLETIDGDKEATPLTLNLFLCALYRHAGFHSDLVYVSADRKNPLSPDKVSEKNTAVAVRVVMNNLSYFCNPAQKKLPFGYLPYWYYNGYARLINKAGGFVILNPEMTKNKYDAIIDLSAIDSAKNKFKLNIRDNFGIYGSVSEREAYTKDSITYKNEYKKQIQKLNPNLNINNYTLKVENLKNIDAPFSLIAEADIEFPDHSGPLDLDPFFKKVNDGENPFQNIKDRETDIKMNLCYQINYTFRFKISDDITIKKLPAKTSLQYASPATIKYVQEATYNTATKTFEAKYNYDIIPGSYDPEETTDLNAFYTEINKSANQKLLLHKQ